MGTVIHATGLALLERDYGSKSGKIQLGLVSLKRNYVKEERNLYML